MNELTSGLAMQVRGLSKVYKIYDSPTDRLRELVYRRKFHRDFVAIEQMDLDIVKGSTLGIVGDNGAGKSTLLQLLCGTLTPTTGSVECSGTVLGLLELGVGFHPEFTGLQNIFFYADLLGLPREFVNAKLDEIIDFSELGEFIGQPIKTYSTGMTMRLAFSLVSTLDPEILVVDEALSVGDMHFQKKCIDRMMAIRNKGRTILFCSHSTYSIGMFCDEVVWMKRGRVHRIGPAAEVLPAYEAYQLQKGTQPDGTREQFRVAPIRVEEFRLLNELPIRPGDDLCFEIRVSSESPERPYHVTLSLKLESGRGVFVTGTHLQGKPPLTGRERTIKVRYAKHRLLGGVYTAQVRIFDDQGLVVYHHKLLTGVEVRKDREEMGICWMENQWEFD